MADVKRCRWWRHKFGPIIERGEQWYVRWCRRCERRFIVVDDGGR